ncbi:C40 family peptidase [Apibacter sp. HY039]|uniref:C40 family peptidase n=1 Tax=Apibacter sp. HY039 TaxID=2501476 RepID=UPI000FEBAF2F|nr:C40 family peptidase [Apibacter sp. HY039]
MKIKNILYAGFSICSILLTSCVSYETSASYKKKSNSSKTSRYTYNSKKSSGHSSKKSTPYVNKTKKEDKAVVLKSEKANVSKSKDVKTVLNEAGKYKGTPYKYGGSTSSGIDCSGLVCVAFQKIDVKLPRRSVDMSNQGDTVPISRVKEGDLLFFSTGGSGINHVGIVYDIKQTGEVSFIHASTSKGVMVSSLEESYWKGKFIKAKRVL